MFGKALGAIAGVIVGLFLQSATMAIFFGCVGLVLGHLLFDREPLVPAEKLKSIDELLGPPAPRPVPRTHPDTVLAKLLCPLFIEVARTDGPVTQGEIRVIREYFVRERHFDADALEQVRQALKKALAGPPVELAAGTKKARARLLPADRPLFVNALYELALVDADLSRSESDAIKQIVGALNLSDEQLQQITSMHLGSGREHYAALGLTEAASDDQLRTAFRRLASDHHPDRFAGRPKREADAAAERFRQITDAWAEVRKLRGI
ncbi:MAG: TerB family tellurite resistance protein [Archangiaceae bacterium]|nr:TerB family tellurite resistance protein [Archangiaceae bacterium]